MSASAFSDLMLVDGQKILWQYRGRYGGGDLAGLRRVEPQRAMTVPGAGCR